MKFVISEEDKKYIKSMYGIVNEQQNKLPYVVNGVYKAIKREDNKEYYITIKELSDELKNGQYGWLLAYVKGPGDYQGRPLDGTEEFEFYPRDPKNSGTIPSDLGVELGGAPGIFGNIQKVSSKPTTTNTKVSPNKSPFIVNGIYKGIRTADNKEYFITISELSDEIKMGKLNSFLMAKIKGPGVDSQGHPYDGNGEYELYYTAPNELSGNMQTGSFQNLQKVSSIQKVSSKPTTTNTKVSPTAKINTTNDRSYDYKLENGKYYYSKKGQNKWIEAKGKGLESIKSKIKF